MKHKIYFINTVLFLLFCPAVAFSSLSDQIERIRDTRQGNRDSFDRHIYKTQSCIEYSNRISLEVVQARQIYNNQMVEVKQICDPRNIDSSLWRFEACVLAQGRLNNGFENLVRSLDDNQCSRLDHQKLIQDVKAIDSVLHEQFLFSKEKSTEFLLDSYSKLYQEVSQKNAALFQPGRCREDISFDYGQLLFWDHEGTLAFGIGDMYGLQKSFMAVKMLRKKIFATAQICGISDVMRQEGAEEIFQKMKARSNISFEKFAKKHL